MIENREEQNSRVSDSQSETPPDALGAPEARPVKVGEGPPEVAGGTDGRAEPQGSEASAGNAGASTGRSPSAGPRPTHVTLAVVLQVRDGCLSVLLWQRAKAPFKGAWSLPGGYLEPGQALE